MSDRESGQDWGQRGPERPGVGVATRQRLPEEQLGREAARRQALDADEEVTTSMVAMAGVLEAVAGVIAGGLALAALAGAVPALLAAVATLALGGALLLEGAILAARYGSLAELVGPRREATRRELGAGVVAEVLGGVAGVVLACAALAGLAPATLLPVALLVFGATLLLSIPAAYRLAAVPAGPARPSDASLGTVRRLFGALSGAQALLAVALVGLGAAALALPGGGLTVVLAGLLTLSVACVIGGTALAALFGQLLSRR